MGIQIEMSFGAATDTKEGGQVVLVVVIYVGAPFQVLWDLHFSGIIVVVIKPICKDIERAFGVLQQEQQVLARPLLLHNIGQVGDRVRTCFIFPTCLWDETNPDDV